ncbi:MAG TPA: hypothetical protein VKA15_13900 [Isosphaeraceae bacterium]|nr:hypothetical protein [Isosphaeraceae bacterium]
MFFSSRKKKPSLLRRLIYLIVLISGGGGVGGWLFKDHPAMQAAWTLVTGKPADEAAKDLDDTLKAAVGDVAGVIKSVDSFGQPGTYQVTISHVHLDPTLFRPGQTVDIQARVLRVDSVRTDTLLWESKRFGERLAVAGKDELVAGWADRPFQVAWKPGQQIVVEVFDRKPKLFVEPRRFIFSSADVKLAEFPLKPGTFPLEPTQMPDPPVDPRNNQIVLQSQRVGDIQGGQRGDERPRQPPPQTADADSPIIIK